MPFIVYIVLFWLSFLIKVIIIKVIVKKDSFTWNLQRDEFFKCWNFREFIFQILCNVWITTVIVQSFWMHIFGMQGFLHHWFLTYFVRIFQINTRNKPTVECLLTFFHYARPHIGYGWGGGGGGGGGKKLGSQTYMMA